MESILNNTQPIHTIPSYASVEEHALYTIASVEESFTDICKSIGIYELSTVMEGEGKIDVKTKLKAVKDKVVKFFVELWKKFQGLCDTAKKKFTAFINEKVNKFKETKLKPEELKDAIDASKDSIWPDNVIVLYEGKAKDLAKATSEATAKILSELNSAKDDPEKIKDIDVEKIYADKCLSKIDGLAAADFSNAGKIRAAVKDIIAKKTDYDVKKYASSNIAGYVSNINKVKLFINEIKPVYNDTKKDLDDFIKEVKKADSDAGFKVMLKAATTATRINSAVVGGIEVAYFKAFVFEYGIVAKAASLALVKKNKKEEAKNESAAPEIPDETTPVAESSSFQTELASLFNF